jgi:fumarylpyruvate hydrolase
VTGVTVPIVGSTERFAVHRVYCLVRNFAAHAHEMGFSGADDPFFFLKPSDADALVVAEGPTPTAIRYPLATERLHPELELVVAVGARGRNIAIADAPRFVLGHAVGFDMTRHDQVAAAERAGRPWCIGKSFDHCAVVGPITPKSVANADDAELELQVNGERRQHARSSQLLWGPARLIAELSQWWELRPGDLIYSGTPAGVAPVQPGDVLVGTISGLEPISIRITNDTANLEDEDV